MAPGGAHKAQCVVSFFYVWLSKPRWPTVTQLLFLVGCGVECGWQIFFFEVVCCQPMLTTCSLTWKFFLAMSPFGSLDGRFLRHLALQHTSHHGHRFGVHEHIQHGRTAYYTAIPLYKAKLVLQCLFQGFQMTLFSWFPLFLRLCCNALGTPTRPLFCDACWQPTQQHPLVCCICKSTKGWASKRV